MLMYRCYAIKKYIILQMVRSLGTTGYHVTSGGSTSRPLVGDYNKPSSQSLPMRPVKPMFKLGEYEPDPNSFANILSRKQRYHLSKGEKLVTTCRVSKFYLILFYWQNPILSYILGNVLFYPIFLAILPLILLFYSFLSPLFHARIFLKNF